MIQIAILFTIIGAGVKYGKAYFLIAGYNTLPKEKKAKIVGIATVFCNTFFGMALVFILVYLLSEWLNFQELNNIISFGRIIIGVVYLLITSNSNKFKIDQGKD